MPPTAKKHQLTCQFELTSSSFLIGRRRILVIPRNNQVESVLENIIMTELEEQIIKPLLSNETLKFYGRHLDDTLVLIKYDGIDKVLKQLKT